MRRPAVRRFGSRCAFIALACALLAACGRDLDHESDREVFAAVERLRGERGDTAQRRLRIADLERIQARTYAAGMTKDECLHAYRELCDAEEEILKAEALMKKAEAEGDLPVSVLTDVATAEEHLQKAKRDLPECDKAAASLALRAR